MEKGMNLESILFRAEDYEPARKYLLRRYVSDINIRRLYAYNNLDQDIPKKLFNNQTETDEKGIIWLKEGVESKHGQRVPLGTDDRVVIPIKNKDGELIGIQTRSIDPLLGKGLRYQGIKYKDEPQIFNIENIDESKTIFVVEGEFCAMQLPNAVATIIWEDLPERWKDNAIIVYDNDDFAESQGKISEAKAAGWNVVEWGDKLPEKYKDITDMVSDRWTTQEIIDKILECAIR
jgi:hypothetical protein